MERPVKQVIVMRTDLNMRKGKMVAQGSHASMRAIIEQGFFTGIDETGFLELIMQKSGPVYQWLHGTFTKVVVGVGSVEELTELYEKARVAKMPRSVVLDKGLTEFHGVETLTCIAIGPYWSDEIDVITGHLKLL